MNIRSFSKQEKKVSLIDKLNTARRAGGDLDIYVFVAGEEDKPVHNIIRPVGDIEIIRNHYIGKFITDADGVPNGIVCPGKSVCPVCKQASSLWNAGDEKSQSIAKQLFAKERSFINIIPRGIIKDKKFQEYDWSDEEARCLVMAFGKTVGNRILEVADQYGDPTDIAEGYDLDIMVSKQSDYGNKYVLEPRKAKVKTERGFSEEIQFNRLSKEELNYELVDLLKYTSPPEQEIIAKIAEIFEVEAGDTPVKNKKTIREELSKEEESSGESEMLCFGNNKVYDFAKLSCKHCDDRQSCKTKIVEDEAKREAKRAKRNEE